MPKAFKHEINKKNAEAFLQVSSPKKGTHDAEFLFVIVMPIGEKGFY